VIRIIKNVFHIAAWEFTARIKSRSFLFLTLLLPVLVFILFTFPLQLKEGANKNTIKLIGLVNLNGVKIFEQIQNHVNQNYILDSGSPVYIFMPVSLNESPLFLQVNREYQAIRTRKDSITQVYDQIVATRTDYYINPRIRDKEYLLEKTYQELIDIRNVKTLIEKEFATTEARVNWIQLEESKRIAESWLREDKIDAYIVIPADFEIQPNLKYYSVHTDDLWAAQQIQKIITEVVVKIKMVEAGLELNLVEQWLKPVHLEKILNKEELLRRDNFLQFYVIGIAVVFLLIAIFTSGGFLLRSVHKEKNDGTIELLMSKTSSTQIMTGKILGLGIVGMIQIAVWSGLSALLIYLNFFPLVSIMYLRYQYFIYFQLIYISGYLFYAPFLVILGTRIKLEHEVQRLNTLGPLVIFILILLLFLIPDDFKALSFRVLLYFPFFTPFLLIINMLKFGLINLTGIYILGAGYLLLIITMLLIARQYFKRILFFAGRESLAKK
jgi:ABC-2 type transport system permease protein